jgi:hypothetical protein
MIGACGPLVLGLLALAGLMAPYSAAAEARRPPNQRLIGVRPRPYGRSALLATDSRIALRPRKPVHERLVFLWQAAVA